MTLRLEQKKDIVEGIRKKAESSQALVVAHNLGLTVSEMTELRVNARRSGVYFKVARNTLVRMGLSGTKYDCIQDSLKGPTLLAFSMDDPGSAARVMRDFAKGHDKLRVTALAISGRALSADQIDAVANLPTLDQALASLASVLQAPISKFARTLGEIPTKIARVLVQVKDKQQA